ncbi:MAG: hypothetical protein JKY15_01280, partial [Deltaproteobacteria bacterium]|nr:hypothetical protein [Deltaproteobacteria bacterium]
MEYLTHLNFRILLKEKITLFMKYILALLISITAFAEPTPTDNYLALTATLLEHRIINDDHLLCMIDGAENNKAINPILESESQIDSQKLIASQAYDNVLKDNIDASQITPWAKERLSQEAKKRSEKKEKQEETKNFKVNNFQRLAINRLYSCAIDKQSMLECWTIKHNEKSLPPKEKIGPVTNIEIGNQVLYAVTKKNRNIIYWDFGKKVLGSLSDIGPVESIKASYFDFCAQTVSGDLYCWHHIQPSPTPSHVHGSVKDFGITSSTLWVIDKNTNALHKKDLYQGNTQWEEVPNLNNAHTISTLISEGVVSVCIIFLDQTAQCFDEENHYNSAKEIPIPAEWQGSIQDTSSGQSYICAVLTGGSTKCCRTDEVDSYGAS